jgi:ABC-type transport system involved in multi-copper enzyme maturation permease subunit
VFFAFLVVAIASALGSVSVGDQMKFMKDFSLAAVSLFGVVIALILGVNLLQKELGNRTILNILSKPVHRWEFIVGKFFGLFGTVTLVVVLMSAVVLFLVAAYEGQTDWGLTLVSATTLLELAVIIAVALFFSSVVVTPTLAGLFTAAVFIAGRSSFYVRYFFRDDHAEWLQTGAHVVYWLLPHLDRFNIADQVVYGDYLSVPYLLYLIGYALSYSALLLLLSIIFFQRREFT